MKKKTPASTISSFRDYYVNELKILQSDIKQIGGINATQLEVKTTPHHLYSFLQEEEEKKLLNSIKEITTDILEVYQLRDLIIKKQLLCNILKKLNERNYRILIEFKSFLEINCENIPIEKAHYDQKKDRLKKSSKGGINKKGHRKPHIKLIEFLVKNSPKPNSQSILNELKTLSKSSKLLEQKFGIYNLELNDKEIIYYDIGQSKLRYKLSNLASKISQYKKAKSL